jgi:hypothetical protein
MELLFAAGGEIYVEALDVPLCISLRTRQLSL